MTSVSSVSLLLVLLCAAGSLGAIRTNIQFPPLDPDVTDPSKLWLAIDNPVPVDYCIHGQIYNPSGKIDPSEGPMAYDILESVQNEKGVKPTGSWQKNLWRFPFNDTKWAALYAYPYTVQPRDYNINLMYMGLPGNKYAEPPEPINSRVDYHIKMYTVDPPSNVTGSEYPILTSSQAWDAGIMIFNGQATINKLTKTHTILDYVDQGRNVVARVFLHKGAPFINIQCNQAQLGIGSLLRGMPPVIELNGKPPGSTVTAQSFQVKVAVGAPHLQGEMWNFYFDKPVTINFPSNPANPLTVTTLYTGLFQVAAGEKDNKMKPFLDRIRGVYAADADVTYDIDDGTPGNLYINFNWKKVVAPGAPTTDLTILAIPHHKEIVQIDAGMSTGNTSYWCTKGPMSYITGDVWKMKYANVPIEWGNEWSVDAAYQAELEKALEFDFKIYKDQCPGDNAFNLSLPGKYNMEFYSYLRQLNKYIDLAIVADTLGKKDIALNLTQQVAGCLRPITEMEQYAPKPCPPAINGTATCVRNQMAMYYDKTYGGIITSWYNRFAVLYCEGCKNREGYYPLANYGNTLYNDHHFQYGFYLRVSAWVLKMAKAGMDVGYTPAEIDDLRVRALAFAREFANPNATDPYFTVMRHKDVYEGHSWAEGLDYNGFVFTWNNQEGGGEAVNAYYSLALLGDVLGDDNIRDWGRLNMVSEMQAVRKYQHLSNTTEEANQIPYKPFNDLMRCSPMLQGNGVTGTTYYGPQAVFACGAITVPFTPITRFLIDPTWAGEAYKWMDWHNKAGGVCFYPDPLTNATNICPGRNEPTWWGNEWSCCPFDLKEFESNLWTAYPNWYPVMYLIQSYNDTKTAWENLQIKDEYHPTEKLPFPYMNSFGYAVGYEPALSRTWALWNVAATPKKAVAAPAAAPSLRKPMKLK